MIEITMTTWTQCSLWTDRREMPVVHGVHYVYAVHSVHAVLSMSQ